MPIPDLDVGPSLAPRGDFPFTEAATYLNSAGMGLVPLPVQRRLTALAEELGTRGTLAFFSRYAEIMEQPRAAAAKLFAAPPDSVAIINSVSEVISQIAWWRRPKAHENVVTIDIDHPSVSYPWLRVATETGADVRFVRVTDDPSSLSIGQIAKLVDERTSVISVSHVQWTTGYRLDVKALAALAHAHRALLVIDATHSAGVVPLDCPGAGVDVLATGSFKWLCSYSGTGACYLSPELADELQPVMVGSRTAGIDQGNLVRADAYQFPQGARRLEYGSSTQMLRVAFGDSLKYILELGIDRVFNHAQVLCSELSDGLTALGAEVLTPREFGSRASIVAARFPGRDALELVQSLEQRGVVVLPRLGAIRFAPHFFNDRNDVRRALSVLTEILSK
jgi:cysteine desulfurase / selenocysteine lyase